MPVLWRRTAAYAVLALYILFFMEWLFYVTKPSFFSVLSPSQALAVLLVAPLPYLLVVCGLLGIARLAQLAASARVAVVTWALIPASLLCATAILMIDNFTYTLFEFGVVTLRSAFRFLYGVV
jgi:hypothetical protein